MKIRLNCYNWPQKVSFSSSVRNFKDRAPNKTDIDQIFFPKA